MKIYFKIFLFFFLWQPSFCLGNNIYSISVCTTSSKEDANRCKKEILKTSNLEAFIQENPNKSYSTYFGNFNSYNEASSTLNSSSNFIKKQKPFIKKFENNEEEKDNTQKNIQQDIQVLNENIDKDIDEKIKEVDKEIKKIDENIILIKKGKALAEEEKRKEQEIRKKIEAETQKIKSEIEEKIKEEQEFTERFRKEKEEEIRKKAEIENQKIKEERDKALSEIQRMEKEKILAEEQQKRAEIEVQKEFTERFRKEKEEKEKAFNEIQKIKEERDKAFIKEKISAPKINHITNLDNTDDFENLVIKIDSLKNIMLLKGKYKDGKIIDIKSYVVSTAKTSIKKPQGTGTITSISLNPDWNPTSKTIKVFKDRGINLPSVVPYGDKLNYMGAAKINLSHRVDGQEVYRIHGTLSENTIGTNESAGCIRMKNKEVVELASFLNKFSKNKSLNNISVILE